jgi:hypothetical protein
VNSSKQQVRVGTYAASRGPRETQGARESRREARVEVGPRRPKGVAGDCSAVAKRNPCDSGRSPGVGEVRSSTVSCRKYRPGRERSGPRPTSTLAGAYVSEFRRTKKYGIGMRLRGAEDKGYWIGRRLRGAEDKGKGIGRRAREDKKGQEVACAQC